MKCKKTLLLYLIHPVLERMPIGSFRKALLAVCLLFIVILGLSYKNCTCLSLCVFSFSSSSCSMEKKQINIKVAHHSKMCKVRDLLRKTVIESDLQNFSSCQRVMYNRLPKCASRTVLSTFRLLSNQLKWHYISAPRMRRYYVTNPDEMYNLTSSISSLEDPYMYSQHVNFIDFEKYQMLQPVYINVMREPVSRAISHYFYHIYGSYSTNSTNRTVPENITQTISLEECLNRDHCLYTNVVLQFFCGHQRICRLGSKPYLLARAKQTVRDFYLVVGLTEDLPNFMRLLSTYLPHFFSNASAVYSQIEEETRRKYSTVMKKEVPPEVLHKLESALSEEIEFYEFIKQRFYNQLRKIQLLKQISSLGLTDAFKIT